MNRPYEEKNNGQPYRLMVWMLRWSLLSNGILSMLVIILSSSLVVLSHRDNLKPFFVTADIASNRVFRVEPLYGNVKTYDIAAMAIARRYVVLRETLDFVTEESRWKEASWLASAEVSEQFLALMSGKNSPLQIFKQRSRRRSVEILSSPKISDDSQTRRTHLIEFKTIDKEPNGITEEKTFQAIVVIDAKPEDVKFNDALLNPYGMNIISYTVQQKKA